MFYCKETKVIEEAPFHYCNSATDNYQQSNTPCLNKFLGIVGCDSGCEFQLSNGKNKKRGDLLEFLKY